MTKKRPDLEVFNWRRDADPLRRRRGIYALYFNKVCLYVGASNDLYCRVSRFFRPVGNQSIANELLEAMLRHYESRRPKARKKVKIFFHRGRLAQLEVSYIRKLNAKLNFSKTYAYDKD